MGKVVPRTIPTTNNDIVVAHTAIITFFFSEDFESNCNLRWRVGKIIEGFLDKIDILLIDLFFSNSGFGRFRFNCTDNGCCRPRISTRINNLFGRWWRYSATINNPWWSHWFAWSSLFFNEIDPIEMSMKNYLLLFFSCSLRFFLLVSHIEMNRYKQKNIFLDDNNVFLFNSMFFSCSLQFLFFPVFFLSFSLLLS